jgi:hypothetical protein
MLMMRYQYEDLFAYYLCGVTLAGLLCAPLILVSSTLLSDARWYLWSWNGLCFFGGLIFFSCICIGLLKFIIPSWRRSERRKKYQQPLGYRIVGLVLSVPFTVGMWYFPTLLLLDGFGFNTVIRTEVVHRVSYNHHGSSKNASCMYDVYVGTPEQRYQVPCATIRSLIKDPERTMEGKEYTLTLLEYEGVILDIAPVLP